jgi:hypothetical protein
MKVRLVIGPLETKGISAAVSEASPGLFDRGFAKAPNINRRHHPNTNM